MQMFMHKRFFIGLDVEIPTMRANLLLSSADNTRSYIPRQNPIRLT